MKTTPATPHFLRVTQALALVSGLGFGFVDCGGRIEGGEPDATAEGGLVVCPASECSSGVVYAPDASEYEASSCGAESGPYFESGVPDTSVAETGAPDVGVSEAGFPEASYGGEAGGPLDPPDLPCRPA